MHINSQMLIKNSEHISVLIHNAVLMGAHRSKKFLSWLIEYDCLYVDSYSTSQKEDFKENLFKVLDLFEDKYKGMFELDFYSISYREFEPYFKVLYPEFTITNSSGDSHQIRDLVVVHRFSYRHSGVFHPDSLQGGRISKTKLEMLSSYQQSHLPGRPYKKWLQNSFEISEFCVGNDTDVSRMMSEFSLGIEWDRYELFLFCVDSMITWESLEGVPFRYMSNIKQADHNRVSSMHNSDRAQAVSLHICAKREALDFDFFVGEGRYKIKRNSRANETVKEVVLQLFSYDEYNSILVTRDPNNAESYLGMSKENAKEGTKIPPEGQEKYTLFRGQKLRARVLKQNEKNQKKVSMEDYIIHPNFLEDVLTRIEARIYRKIVTQSTAKRASTSNNATRSATTDSISV